MAPGIMGNGRIMMEHNTEIFSLVPIRVNITNNILRFPSLIISYWAKEISHKLQRLTFLLPELMNGNHSINGHLKIKKMKLCTCNLIANLAQPNLQQAIVSVNI